MRPFEISYNRFVPQKGAGRTNSVAAMFRKQVAQYAQPEQVPYMLGGESLGGLGAEAGGEPTPIVGLSSTNNGAVQLFFGAYGNSGGCDGREGAWTPISEGQIRAINVRLGELQAAADLNPQADASLQSWRSSARALMGQVDQLERHDVWAGIPCGRSDSREKALRGAMRALKAHLLSGASLPVPVSPPASAPEPSPAYSPPAYPPVTGSKSGGMTAGGQPPVVSAGIPAWAKALGGIVLLGGVAYVGSKLLKGK